ncbi:SatD family protein [Nocardioides sp. InS609-2]|uniref:SatD family protein n=1 Tax=Nocardioides sp. InS609-2 TaxID=2760705 RepID=UPI0020C0C222|nr:SatD family protein [Nocardioides sp. InS609-2]
MGEMKEKPSAVLIGDMVGSRLSADRTGLHDRLVATLAEVNATFAPVADLTVFAGDEYQGTFADVGTALAASLHLRLALLPHVDVRQGIAWGPVAVLAESPRVEDGPGWWSARAAIVEVEDDATRSVTRSARTRYALAPDVTGPETGAINAALLARDHLVGRLDERSLSVLRGLLSGQTQQQLARAEGISASAVSQRVRNDGLGVVMAMEEQLRGIR